jgi:hypothetical protein
MGTAVGFILKYLLDKRWVFDDGYSGHRQELQKITLYGVFSVITTLVFWGFEVAFWVIWHTDFAKYAGAVLGLAIGYAAKNSPDGDDILAIYRSCSVQPAPAPCLSSWYLNRGSSPAGMGEPTAMQPLARRQRSRR